MTAELFKTLNPLYQTFQWKTKRQMTKNHRNWQKFNILLSLSSFRLVSILVYMRLSKATIMPVREIIFVSIFVQKDKKKVLEFSLGMCNV